MSNTVTLQKDFYKCSHTKMLPDNMILQFNNLTPRNSRKKRYDGTTIDKVVVAGFQYLILEYFIKQWNQDFFGEGHQRFSSAERGGKMLFNGEWKKHDVIQKYKRICDNCLGRDSVSTEHLEAIWNLGYLPIEVRALPEGTLCPIGIPAMTYHNTHKAGFFLPGMLETIISVIVWQPMTSATLAYEMRKMFDKFAQETSDDLEFVGWQGHDFSMRGMGSLEAAKTSGFGHLLSFTGTDTIPAIEFCEEYYEANVTRELVGGSVPASEHSVECMNYDFEQGSDKDYILRLCKLYPNGIVSCVLDGFDYWGALTETLLDPDVHSAIIDRNGKFVVRGDSGNPVDIVAGLDKNSYYITEDGKYRDVATAELIPEHIVKGSVETLYDIFGGEINSKGYKVLCSKIGFIYGDAITLDRAYEICRRLKEKKFASTNWVAGVGSFTYQYNTRDSFGFAVKATAGQIENKGEGFSRIINKSIYKAPKTDNGKKNSAKGFLKVIRNTKGELELLQDVSFSEIQSVDNELKLIFKDGKAYNKQSLSKIRSVLQKEKEKIFTEQG